MRIGCYGAERAMRPVALGRKNWLFAGSHHGGSMAAIVMSVIETAKIKRQNIMERIKGLLLQEDSKVTMDTDSSSEVTRII